MTHAEQTADGLATWIERRQHTPAELRQILRLALQDAETRGARLASLEAPPDPLPEPAAAVERPLNARMGRRWTVGANGIAPQTIDLSGLHFYGNKKRD